TFVTRFIVSLSKNSVYGDGHCCSKGSHEVNPLAKIQPGLATIHLFIVVKYGFWDVSVTDLKV
ncbi:MAG: hypothetical protein AAFU84_17735, partial [Cyanobacteria bacterium J06633_23]